MKNFTKLLFYVACMFLAMPGIYAQVSIIESFDSGTPAGWTDSYSNTSSQACSGSSERDNLYSGSSTGNMTTSNQTGASNGTDVTFSIDYKIVDWSAATVPTAAGWGSADLEYSLDDGVTWTNAGTIDDSNNHGTNVCQTFGVTIAGANVPTGSDLKFRVNNTWAGGDYYFYIDNFVATQVAANPPNCDAALTSDLTDFPIDGTLTWSAATGGPTGYKVSVGSTPGGTDIANNVDVMATTSYSLMGLMYSTTYYVTITPYNDNGDAMGCTEESFVTAADPNMVFTVDCEAGATNTTHCYDNNDGTTFTYTAIDGTSGLELTFNSGGMEGCCDDIIIYDGTDDTGAILYNGNNGGDLTGLVVAGGTSIHMVIDSDGSVSCASGSSCCTTQWDWDVACVACIPPTASGSEVFTCPLTDVSIDVVITDLGSAGSLIISNSLNATTVPAAATGTYSVPGFMLGDGTVTITVGDASDPTCFTTFDVDISSACPPANDNCMDALPLTESANDGSCANTVSGTTTGASQSPETSLCSTFSNDDDVWYTLTAAETQIYNFELTNTTSNTYVHVYSGDCAGGLTSIGGCFSSNDNSASLVAGTTYYVQVHTSSSTITSDFDLCAYPIPDPNMDFTVDCAAGPTNTTHCYGNNDVTTFTYTSSDGSDLVLTFNGGGIESCCDNIMIYDGMDATGTLLYTGNNGGNLTGLVVSGGSSIHMVIDSDGSVSCASGSSCCTTEWDWDVDCLVCGAAAVVLPPAGMATTIPATASCDDGPWSYYEDPANPGTYVFAIEWDVAGTGSNAAAKAAAAVTIDVQAAVFEPAGNSGAAASAAMARHWNVDLGGAALADPVNVKFYYDPAEITAVNAAVAAYGVPNGFQWYKNNDGANYSHPAYITAADFQANVLLLPVAGSGMENGVTYVQFDGIASFSGGSGASGTGGGFLPVELASFTGKTMSTTNMLEWVTASEENTEWHVIERSKDGRSDWTEVGRTEAKGFSNELISYQLEDAKPMAKSYYRLRSVDFDGYEDLSNVIYLEREIERFDIVKVYPVPTSKLLNVDFETIEDQQVDIALTDMLGKVVTTRPIGAVAGMNTATFDMSNLANGVYFVTINNGQNKITQRVVKN